MQFKVSSTLLCERLQAAAKFIPAKPSLSIYGYYLFSISGNQLTITASDADTTLITVLDIENSGSDGRVAMQSKVLTEVLKEFSEQQVEFNIDDNTYNVIMTTESSKYNFMGQNAADFMEPSQIGGDNVKAFTLSVSLLNDAIAKTSYAVAFDEIRPIMNGLCFKFDDEGLNVVATDGHRLAKVTLPNEKPGLQGGFIFPQKPANLLRGILAKEVGSVEIMYDEKSIVFTTAAYKMICRQIEGNYPNYNAVIPQNFNNSAIVNRESILSIARRVGVCSDQGTNLIKLKFTSGNVCVSGQDIDFAVAGTENFKCSFEGSDIEIGFKASILIDLLSSLDSDDVEMKMVDQARPAVFVPIQQKEGVSVLSLAMPMMIP
ncbi:MAG: DNA polymerase III subunit beta [Paludibacteraceae bacterium]|nr:DNA polymerase III subunit beta [Paludibacteraceae bacterium]